MGNGVPAANGGQQLKSVPSEASLWAACVAVAEAT